MSRVIRNYNPQASYQGYLFRRNQMQAEMFFAMGARIFRFLFRLATIAYLTSALPGDFYQLYLPCIPELRQRCGGADPFMNQFMFVAIVVMIMNSVRLQLDMPRHRRTIDRRHRRIRITSTYAATAIAVAALYRYQDGLGGVTLAAVLLVLDAVFVDVAHVVQGSFVGKTAELRDYNYVAHAERITLRN